MAILILGATILVASVVVAARTSEGSWLIYFESLAERSSASETQKATSVRTFSQNQGEDIPVDGIDIVAIPSHGQTGTRVLH